MSTLFYDDEIGSEGVSDRLDAARQQNAILGQLQEVTRRWHEEKAQLLKSFEEEREIWADERADLQKEVWSMTEAWKKASVQLVATSAQLSAAQEEVETLKASVVPTQLRPSARFLKRCVTCNCFCARGCCLRVSACFCAVSYLKFFVCVCIMFACPRGVNHASVQHSTQVRFCAGFSRAVVSLCSSILRLNF